MSTEIQLFMGLIVLLRRPIAAAIGNSKIRRIFGRLKKGLV